MRKWNEINMNTVFDGFEDGVRLLPEFLKDYQITFSEVPEASCRKCLIRYYNKLTKYLSKMNTKNNSSFKLKAMFNGIQFGFGSNNIITNTNLTDEIAIKLIDNHPHGEKLFDVVPSNVEEIRESIDLKEVNSDQDQGDQDQGDQDQGDQDQGDQDQGDQDQGDQDQSDQDQSDQDLNSLEKDDLIKLAKSLNLNASKRMKEGTIIKMIQEARKS